MAPPKGGEKGSAGGAVAPPSKTLAVQTYLFAPPKNLEGPYTGAFGESPIFLESLSLSPGTPI